MKALWRASAAAAVVAVAVVAWATAAGADPRGEVLPLQCGSAQFLVVVAGQGEFTPAHDLDSTTVFVPVAFGASSATLTDVTAGQVVYSDTDPTVVTKGGAQARGRTLLTCTYSFSDEFVAGADEPGPTGEPLVEGHRYRFEVEGLVTGFPTGRH